MLAMDQPFSDSEREIWKQFMQDVYETFVSKVAQGRKLDRKRLDALAGGRIWTGRQAQQNGLVDEVGTLYDAIEAAKKLAGVKPDEQLELLEMPEPRSFFDQLLDVPAEESRVQVRDALNQLTPAAAERLQDWATLQPLFAEPALMLTPYRIEIR
jgi:protease-4